MKVQLGPAIVMNSVDFKNQNKPDEYSGFSILNTNFNANLYFNFRIINLIIKQNFQRFYERAAN